MKETYITSKEHALYKKFKELYEISFPIFEQRSENQQQQAFGDGRYKLVAFTDEDGETFIGFISYWQFDTYRYVEHLAINKNLRGKGFGSKILEHFIKSPGGMTILEIDPIVDRISESRLKFYQKCGFNRNPYPHKHPPYNKDYKPHELIIMTSERPISATEYQTFNNDLCNAVMKNCTDCDM